MGDESQTAPTEVAELATALRRADRLITWMTAYIGNMAPGNYAECYRDLNEHGLFMSRLNRNASTPTESQTIELQWFRTALMRIANPDDECHCGASGPWQDVAQRALWFAVTDGGDWYDSNGRRLSVPEMIARRRITTD